MSGAPYIETWMFKRDGGDIEPALGIYTAMAAARAARRSSRMLQHDYAIVKVFLYAKRHDELPPTGKVFRIKRGHITDTYKLLNTVLYDIRQALLAGATVNIEEPPKGSLENEITTTP